MALITINGVSLDPIAQAQAFKVAGFESVDASQSDYILVQTSAPLSPEQKDELARLGLVIHEYVSENTYLCGYKGTDLAQIRALPFVTWANVYLQEFKVAPNLSPATTAPALNILPTRVGASHPRHASIRPASRWVDTRSVSRSRSGTWTTSPRSTQCGSSRRSRRRSCTTTWPGRS